MIIFLLGTGYLLMPSVARQGNSELLNHEISSLFTSHSALLKLRWASHSLFFNGGKNKGTKKATA
jgi:hypothetical protein